MLGPLQRTWPPSGWVARSQKGAHGGHPYQQEQTVLRSHYCNLDPYFQKIYKRHSGKPNET